MKRKLVSYILVLVLCLTLAIPAFAAETQFIVDGFDVLSAGELEKLNEQAAEIYEQRGVGIFFVYTMEESLSDFDYASLVGDMDDYFIMIENEEKWKAVKAGLGTTIDSDTEDQLRDVYNAEDTYVGGIEKFLAAAAKLFPLQQTEPRQPVTNEEEYVLYDEADLLTDSEETALTEKLLEASHKYNAQLVVITISSMDGGDIDEFVEYCYDSMGFGYGKNHDGILLLVSMDPREFRILSNGLAGDAISESAIDTMTSAITPDLSDGDYADAFDIFVDKCVYYIDGHLNGFPFDVGGTLLLSVFIGFIVGVLVTMILKGQLKSVRKQDRASVYVKPGSMHLTQHSDMFLYRDVSRTRRETSNSSGSSGGGSRNVGGGSF